MGKHKPGKVRFAPRKMALVPTNFGPATRVDVQQAVAQHLEGGGYIEKLRPQVEPSRQYISTNKSSSPYESIVPKGPLL